MKTLKLFREMIAVKSAKEEVKGSIIMPENRLIRHDLGEVVSIGDGHYRTGENKTIWVKPGDLIMFQLGGPQQNNSLYKINGESTRVFHQGDAIARLKTNLVTLENFEILGDWVLLTVAIDQGLIVVPEKVASPETFKFHLLQKGAGFKLDIEIGDEVIPERGKCAPIEVDGKTYVFTHQDFLHGALKEDKAQ